VHIVAKDIHSANLCQASDCTHSLLFILFAHLLVISKFHRERSKAGCDRAKCRWVVTQLCQRCSSRHNAGVMPVANWNDVTMSLCNVRQHNAKLVLINCNLQHNSSYCAYFLLIVCTSAVDCLKRLIAEITYYVYSGTVDINLCSLTYSLSLSDSRTTVF